MENVGSSGVRENSRVNLTRVPPSVGFSRSRNGLFVYGKLNQPYGESVQALTIEETNEVSGAISASDVVGGLVGTLAAADIGAAGFAAASYGSILGPVGAGVGFLIGAGLVYAIDHYA